MLMLLLLLLRNMYVVDIESVKDSYMLRLPSDRYSPVRRLSDGLTTVRKYKSQLEKIYKKALQNQVTSNNSSLLHVIGLLNDTVLFAVCKYLS